FNYCLEMGTIPKSWSKSIITLIPKKAESLYDVNNWRPISLTNSDAKIFMKILANRANKICSSIIGPSQQAFIKGRSIVDTALDIITTLRNQDDQTLSHWLILLDQQKAFDRMSHKFIIQVLEKMNFDNNFIKIVKTLFSLQVAHIADSGRLSEPIRVERGVRQGDPLSPLLYVLAFNPLILKLQEEIQGIKLRNQLFKAVAYADDLTIGIGSSTDWSKILTLLKKYEKATNAKINQDKSIIIPLTNMARSEELPNQQNFKIASNNDSLRILGYEVDSRGNPKKRLWEELTDSIKYKIEKLKLRNLSFKGKILIAKALLISKIWYLAYLLPLSRKQLDKINTLISGWIKNKSRMLPKYLTFQLDYERGGLAAPVLKDTLDSRLTSVWLK